MHPVDPGEHWLAAGITGLPRQREWDAVAAVSAPGTPEAEAAFVTLEDGRLLVEEAPEGFDPAPFAAALEGSVEAPYRAVARRRSDRWAVGAMAIEVARLDPDPRGDDLELTFDGETLALMIDGLPVGAADGVSLQAIAESRHGAAYAAHAHRLAENLFEVLILPL